MVFAQGVMETAAKIADNCQGSHLSFCSARCPMHTDVLGYVNLVGENKLTEALLKIREKVFLPGTLGRVCAHPCEDKCRRGVEFSQPISIAALKRYAADNADSETLWDVSAKPDTGKKAAVIGCGPAGAQAAIDLAKEGLRVTVYEKFDQRGGMLRMGIPEYRLPRKVIDFEFSYLDKLGIEIKTGIEVGKDVTFAEIADSYDVVVLAVGAHKGFIPPIEGKDTPGVQTAVDFLRETSLGVKSKSLAGKKVVVIGGGDVAMDCARSALRLSAADVKLACLEKEDEMPASGHEQEGAKDEGISFLCGWGAEKVVSEDGQLKEICLKRCLSVFNDEGRFAPVYGDEKLALECDVLIFATGQLVADITGGALPQGPQGRYVADKETLATSIDKVFVAGDCAGGTIVIEAMALGRKAAVSAIRFLAGQDLKAGRDFEAEWATEPKLDIPMPDDVQDIPRKRTQMLAPDLRKANFDECDLGLNEPDAIAEGSRCLSCECKKCMTECLMLNEFTTYPGELMTQFLKDGNLLPLMVYSCNMCDQCTIVCPEEFKFAEFFGAARQDMVKANNGNSPMAGHKAINMHQKLGFSKFFTTRHKGGKR